MNTKTTALVLAAGIGKRFWPLTGAKSLFSFAEEPLLATTLTALARAGFSRIVVVASPQDYANITALRISGAEIAVVEQSHASGMANAVLAAKDEIGGAPCLILNAHDVVDEALFTRVSSETKGESAFVVGKSVSSYFDGGYIQMDGARVSQIVEKPGEGKAPSRFVNLVFHFFPRLDEFANTIGSVKSKGDDVYEKALSLYAQTHTVRLVPYEGLWLPLKYPWHILDILPTRLLQLRGRRGRNVHIGANVVIEGEVVLGDDVHIFENTKIVGPCFIGAGTIVNNNNIIRESIIGEGCVTGFSTEITRSVVGSGCWFHNNYIGDSVVAADVYLGGGTKLANLRLDEGEISSWVGDTKMKTGRTKLGAIIGTGVRIGINASIMPGVKIGEGSFVGAGVVLDRDVPDRSFCFARPGYEIKPNTKRVSSEARKTFKARI